MLQSQAETIPKISVVIPVRNGEMHLARCLEALTSSQRMDFELIVVDDCSTDGTCSIAERYGAFYFRTPRPMGPGAARNLGARHAKGEILTFVDADVVLPPGALRLVFDDFCRDPELAAEFGTYDDEPAWPAFFSQYKNLMHSYVHQTSSESAVTFWAGCGAIRKAIFEECGGFDAAKYPTPSIEDIALGHVLVGSGRKIRLNKELRVKHLKRWTFRSMLRADIFHRAVPWTELILKTSYVPRDLNLTYASRASSGLVTLLAGACILLSLGLTGLAPRLPVLMITSIGSIVVLLLLLNWDIYKFFLQKRGRWFAARAVLAHWLYYLYSGVTFSVCAMIYFLSPSFHVGIFARAESGFIRGRGIQPGTQETEISTSARTAVRSRVAVPSSSGPVKHVTSKEAKPQLPLPSALLLAFTPLNRFAMGVAWGVILGGLIFLMTVVLLVRDGYPIGPNLSLLGQLLFGYHVTWWGAAFGLLWGFGIGFALGWGFALTRNLIVWLWLAMVRSRAEMDQYADFLDHL